MIIQNNAAMLHHLCAFIFSSLLNFNHQSYTLYRMYYKDSPSASTSASFGQALIFPLSNIP